MRRLAFFVIGLLSGALIGAAASLLTVPASGNALRQDARNRFDNLLADAQQAAESRRTELEAELATLTRPAAH